MLVIVIRLHGDYFISGLKSSEGTTQGDQRAMAVSAIATIPLLLMILEIPSNDSTDSSKVVAYADDFIAVGSINGNDGMFYVISDRNLDISKNQINIG